MPHTGPALEKPVAMNELLSRGLATRPDEPALISLQASWTWRELDRDGDRLAKNLLNLGLKPGDRVATLMPNRCITEVLYIACIRAGLVATPLNYRYMAPEIDHGSPATVPSVVTRCTLTRGSCGDSGSSVTARATVSSAIQLASK